MKKMILLFSYAFICFFSLFSELPAFGEKVSKEKLRGLIAGMDDPYSFERILRICEENPDTLSEVLFIDDRSNHYGRYNGLSFWQVLAWTGKIEIEKYFDVAIRLLLEIKFLAPTKLLDDEHRAVIKSLASFGIKPFKATPIYKDFASSLDFLIICIKTLNKYEFIKSAEVFDNILKQVDEIKNSCVKTDGKKKGETSQKLRSFINDIDSRKADLTDDCREVITKFTRNLITQIDSVDK